MLSNLEAREADPRLLGEVGDLILICPQHRILLIFDPLLQLDINISDNNSD